MVKTFITTHLFYIILIAVGVVSFRMWLSEHDARLTADAKVKEAQTQIASIVTQAAAQVKVVTKVVHDAVTPSQVVAAVPTLTDVPLATREITGNPVDVEVAAQPLMQLVGELKTAQIELGACQQVSVLKDQQIAALKKKPKFFTRLKRVAEAVGVGVGIGLLLGAHGL